MLRSEVSPGRRNRVHDVYEPISTFGPVLVNHEVNMWGAPIVVTRIDGGYFHHAICISVPTTAEPALRAVEIGTVPAVLAGGIS